MTTTLTARHRPTVTLAFDIDTGSEEEVVVALRQVTNPNRVSLIREQLGLTDATLILEGRLVTPRTLPGSVTAGAVAELTWGGARGAARLEPPQ